MWVMAVPADNDDRGEFDLRGGDRGAAKREELRRRKREVED